MQKHFVWNELLTGDVERAKDFLSEVLRWEFEEFSLPSGLYWLASFEGESVGGVCHFDFSSLDVNSSVWLSFVQVDDIDGTWLTAVRSGARGIREPHDVPGVGRVAIIIEPTGAPLGLLAPSE